MLDDLPDPGLDAEAIASKTAAATLDKVREGGTIIVNLTRQRLKEAGEAVDEGRFNDAARNMQEALTKLQSLAHAEAALGELADGTRIIRAKDVEEGMHLIAYGVVTKRGQHECARPGATNHTHIDLSFEDGEDAEFHAEQEVAIRIEPGAAA